MSMNKEEKERVKNKIRSIVYTALENNHSNLILGAWGCGAYGCDQKTMATLWKDILENEFRYYPLNFYFVILGKSFFIFDEILS
jgi:uncharacterized protein (TIGR02452 family)